MLTSKPIACSCYHILMRRSPRHRAVIFDWDGTILDSWAADSKAYLEMFRILGIPWGVAEVERHYSPDWHRIYRAAGIPKKNWMEADRLWFRAYQRENPPLVPGARRVLEEIKRGTPLALVTSGSRQRVTRQLRRKKLTRFFPVCVCAEDAMYRKPHPAPLQAALQQLELPSRACIYVGDTPEDVEMAQRAGMTAVAVLGPFPTRQTVVAAMPDVLLCSLEELPGWLLGKSNVIG